MDQLFNHNVAVAVENAVSEIFVCEKSEFFRFEDTDVKKTVVFILYHFFEYDWKFIGKAYQMTYLYVPTVADYTFIKYKDDSSYRERIDWVLNKVESLKIAV